MSEFCGADFLKNYINTALGLPPTEAKLREDVSIRWIVPHERQGQKLEDFP